MNQVEEPKKNVEPDKNIRVEKPLGVKPETTFNLKTILDDQPEEEEQQEIRFDFVKITTEFSFEDLKLFWDLFLSDLETENKMASFNALQSAKIRLRDNFLIEVEFSSSSMSKEFEHLKERLVGFLREKLNNNVIEFKLLVSERETENFIKLPAEIFKEMVEKNPILLKLKKDLDLDYNSND